LEAGCNLRIDFEKVRDNESTQRAEYHEGEVEDAKQ